MRKTPIPDVPIFGDSSPRDNPLAGLAYRLAVWSITPILGLFLGIAGLVTGLFAWRRYRANPEIEGRPQSIAAVMLGGICAIFQAAGLYCLARGFGWLN